MKKVYNIFENSETLSRKFNMVSLLVINSGFFIKLLTKDIVRFRYETKQIQEVLKKDINKYLMK